MFYQKVRLHRHGLLYPLLKKVQGFLLWYPVQLKLCKMVELMLVRLE